MEHGCIECTHKKRYRSDLEREGAEIRGAEYENVVAGDDLNDDNMVSSIIFEGNKHLIYQTRISEMHLLV